MAEMRSKLLGPQSERALKPVEKLWVAVLFNVADELHGRPQPGQGTGRRLARRAEAAAWLSSPETTPGAFLWICHQLGLEPVNVRAKLEAPALVGSPAPPVDFPGVSRYATA